MKTLEKREKCGKNGKTNIKGVPTKLLIYQLPFIIILKTWYLIKAKLIIFLYSVI